MKNIFFALVLISSMSLSIHAEDVCVGDSVVLTINSDHFNVSVREIYEDGTAKIEFANGNSGTYNLSLLSYARHELNGLRVGDNVVLTVSDSHYNVTIKEIFADNKVSVAFANGNTSTYDISLLSRSRHEVNGIRVGEKAVLTVGDSHYNITLKEIFQDGKVSVEFANGNTSTYDASLISLARNEVNGISVGESVVLTISDSHYNVTLKEIFDDGNVSVEFANGNVSTYNSSLISRALNYLHGLEVNDQVVLTINSNHYNVTIKEIFVDGKVSVEFANGNTSTYDSSLLSKAVTCTNSRECGDHKDRRDNGRGNRRERRE